jgi:WD40 repeat protein
MRSKLPTAAIRKTIGTPFAASSDLRWVATGLENDRIRVTDLTSGQIAWEANTGVTINSLAIDPAGTTLAAGIHQADAFIQLFHLATGQEIGRLPARAGYVICMQFAPDGRTLLAAGSDQTITYWDVSRRQILATLRGHSLEVWRAALLADGKTVVSGSGDGDILVWNLESDGRHDFRTTLAVAPRACWRFAPGSDAILTCELNGGVTRWTGRGFEERQTLLNVGTGLASVVLSDDCGTVAASFTNGNIRIWNLNDGALRREFKSGSNAAVVWGFAGDSNRLLVVNEPDQSLHEWDLSTGAEQTPGADLAGWRVHGAFPGEARQRSTGREVKRRFDSVPRAQRLPEVVSRLFAGVFSADHRCFARSLQLSVVEVQDAGTGQVLGQVRGFLQGVHSLAFSPDSRRLAAGSDAREAVKL